MQTAVYVAHRVPNAALGNITPHTCFYGKEADLGYLRVNGIKALTLKRTPRRSTPRPGKHGSVGTAWTASRFGSTSGQEKGRGK